MDPDHSVGGQRSVHQRRGTGWDQQRFERWRRREFHPDEREDKVLQRTQVVCQRKDVLPEHGAHCLLRRAGHRIGDDQIDRIEHPNIL